MKSKSSPSDREFDSFAECMEDIELIRPRGRPTHVGRTNKEDRKAKQLCRQVADTLSLVLAGDGRDELLGCLQVQSVVPAPNASRLLVTVTADLGEQVVDTQQVLDRLAVQMGRLRAEVAASINRKRVPLLLFQVVGRTNLVD